MSNLKACHLDMSCGTNFVLSYIFLLIIQILSIKFLNKFKTCFCDILNIYSYEKNFAFGI